jgi:hypothetical protein
VCPSCQLVGFTDADLCQDCARELLLAETRLHQQWSDSMRVFRQYEEWKAGQDRIAEAAATKKKEAGGDAKAAEKAAADATRPTDSDFNVSTVWWRTWKKQLDAAAKALHVDPIGPKSGKKKAAAATASGASGAAAGTASSAAASGLPKPLPTIPNDVDTTADIRCEHGHLLPDSKGFTVAADIWHALKKLHPQSQDVPVRMVNGEETACGQCIASAEEVSASTKQRKEQLKLEKGKLKLVKSKTAIADFPLARKPPHEGTYHLLPTPWVLQLLAYFNELHGVRPPPINTKSLLCPHGKLLYEPWPEEDRSVLPAAITSLTASPHHTATAAPRTAPAVVDLTAMNDVATEAPAIPTGDSAPATPSAPSGAPATPPASASNGAPSAATAAPPSPSATGPKSPVLHAVAHAAISEATLQSRMHSTPPGVMTLCEEADYQHLLQQKWIEADDTCPDVTVTIKRKHNAREFGEATSWEHLSVKSSLELCEACARARISDLHTGALKYENASMTVHRVRPDEKVEDPTEHQLQALVEGRRASARVKKAPVRAGGGGATFKPIQVHLSSSDDINTVRLKICEAAGGQANMMPAFLDVIFIKEGSQS